MNIQEAKDSILDAVRVYLSKDPAGNYLIPRSRQRPLVVMGPPGLGKTAIMSQVASELGIGFVSYTITHHTRQSAIGLPMIDTAEFDGRNVPVTRYTMSEIVASVYDAIEEDGYPEGILFVDEINCVSETLAPAMLDLLQNKKFGPHEIPDGWILVAAGNPPEFNSSARELDVATLDRVRVIDVEPDTDVWLKYAVGAGMHGAVVYYLQIKPQNLLRMERTPEGVSFVTPRGWEDLSTVMKEYDRLGLSADVNLMSQYVRDPEIAAEFKRYSDFHRKYSEEYDVESILDGTSDDRSALASAGAEEKLAVISVMVGSLNSLAEKGMDLEFLVRKLEGDPAITVRRELLKTLDSDASADARRRASFAISFMKDSVDTEILLGSVGDLLKSAREEFDFRLGNAMEFMKGAFGTGQETVSLLVGLISCYNVVMFSEPDGPLYRYNDELLEGGRSRRIMDLIGADAQ